MLRSMTAGLVLSMCFALNAYAGDSGKLLLDEDFDKGFSGGWDGLGGGWSLEEGVGRGGSCALVWRKPDAGKKPSLLKCPLAAFRPGMKLEVSCRAKVLDPGSKPPPAHLCDIEWWNLDGEWAGGMGLGYEAIFRRLPVDGDGWSEIRFEVPYQRADVSRSVFEFFTLPDTAGVVAVDDVVIRVTERRALTQARSSAYRGKSRDGKVSFSAGMGFDPKDTPLDTLKCTFAFRGAAGGTRTVEADEINYRWARVTLDTEDFAVGSNDVRVTLATLSGKVLDTRTIPFERLAPDSKMPRVYIDGCGRAIVNGKRFFPLGMFWHDGDLKKIPDALELYAKGPFNCLQTYDMPVTVEMLDAFWKHGLYVMPTLCNRTYLISSMKTRPRGDLEPLPGLDTEEDVRAELARYVNGLKRHPAVLAWYTCDEFFPWLGPLYAERAEMLRRIDPDHPHYAVGNMEAYVPYLSDGFDVYGIDYYCIRMKGDSESLLVPDRGPVWRCVEKLEAMRDECGGILLQWPVPQAFARGWDYTRSMKEEDWRKLSFPTAREFRAMCWQYIAAGANGLMHYAYGQMLFWNRTKKLFSDEEFAEAWRAVCDASAEVKAQIPVLLKDAGAKPRNVSKNARVRTWRDESADYVLVCNLRPDPLSGTVDIDLGGDVVDWLTGEGTVSRTSKGLSFSLGPFEHAFVKIPHASAGVGGAAKVKTFAPGVIEMDSTMCIGSESSGMVFRSADPSRPAVLSGGRTVTGWQVGEDGVWRTTLPDVKSGKWDFSTLYVNGKRRMRPCIPATGYNLAVTNAFVAEGGRSVCGFAFKPRDIPASLSNLEDVEVQALHLWNTTRARIASIDAREGLLRFAKPRMASGNHAFAFNGCRYRLENVKEAFVEPGTWYLDRPTGVLAYRPLPGETPANAEVVAPRLKTLVRIDGAAGVKFENVVFAYHNLVTPETGRFAIQGGWNVPAAVEVAASRDVSFVRCGFTHTDGYAVDVAWNCEGTVVSDSMLCDLGAGGVRIGNFDRSKILEMGGKRGTTVGNCRITDGGHVFPEGVGVFIGRSSYNTVVSNEIDHLRYSGVSVGWDWDDKRPSKAHHNEIAYNHIHDIGLGLLSDMGMIYLLGRAPGTTVHDNNLHDVSCFTYGGNGIYPDEGSSELKIWNNVVRNAKAKCYHQNYGEENEVFNNIFVNSKLMQWDCKPPKGSVVDSVNMHHNIFVWREGKFFERSWPFAFHMTAKEREDWMAETPVWQGFSSDSNILWRIDGKEPDFCGMPYSEWVEKSGHDKDSFVGDPGFSGDVFSGDCSLAPDSPAVLLGFKPFASVCYTNRFDMICWKNNKESKKRKK